MSMRVVCPEGHPVVVEKSKLGGTAYCPCCFAAFRVELPDVSSHRASKEERKARKSRDDDDEADDEIEFLDDDEPPAKKPAKKPKNDDAHDEVEFLDDDEPKAKKPPAKKKTEDEVEFLDDDEAPAKKSSAKQAKKDAKEDAIAEGEAPVKKMPAKKSKDEDEEAPRVKKAPRDDDEDDEEDDEDDRPRKKKKVRKDDEDEDEDDEDDEDDEVDHDDPRFPEEEPAPPIEWTPRKRQLNVGSLGLIAMLIGNFAFLAFTLFNDVWVFFFEILGMDVHFLWDFISLPLGFLGLTGFVAGAVVNLWAPAKIEGRASLISTLVFSGIVYFFGFLAVLTYWGVILADPARALNLVQVLAGGMVICTVIGLLSAMAYLTKLMIFMRLHLEKSQAVTNMGFIMMGQGIMLALIYASPFAKEKIGDWMRFIIDGISAIVTGHMIFTFVVLGLLLIKIRRTIDKYIREE